MWKIVLYIAIGIIALFLIFIITTVLVHKKLFGKRFEKDPLVKYFTPEDFNISRESFFVPTKKGKLNGYLYNKDKHTKDPLIVFAHGMWCNVDAYNQDICYYANNGYEVLALNHHGVDKSEGKNIKGLANSLESLDETLNYIEFLDEFKGRDIYLVGHSWGAYAVLSVLKFHKEVKKVVSISPFVTPTRLVKNMIPKFARFLIPLFLLIEKIKFGKYGNVSAIDAAADFTGDILILHSTDDPMVNYEANTKYLQSVNNKINYRISENRQHNPNYSQESCDLMLEYNTKMRTLSKDEQIKLKKNTDYAALGILDNDVMDEIVAFLDK